jgi:hypothetical protein
MISASIVRVSLGHDAVAAMAERQQGHVVPLRRAVHQPPRSPRAPRLRRQALGLAERRGLVADVDPVGQRRDVDGEDALAEGLYEAGVGARPALVAGYVEAPRLAGRPCAQGVEVRGVGLARQEGDESRW